jgi:hypothetical protein
MRRTPLWIALLSLSSPLASGCALTDARLAPPLPKEVATGSRRGAQREIVVLLPFANKRAQARCGMKKNGLGMDTASVRCAEAPEATLGALVVAELSAAGFKVSRDLNAAGPSTLVVSGALEQTFMEPYSNGFTLAFETDLALRLTAWTRTGLIAERRFYVKGEEATYFASEADMDRSYQSAARQLVASVVGAVSNLADRAPYDELRAAPPSGGARTRTKEADDDE